SPPREGQGLRGWGEILGEVARPRSPQGLAGWKRARDSDDEDARGPGHRDVLRTVADVGRVRRGDAEPLEPQVQGLGMRFLSRDVLGAHDGAKPSGQTVAVELALDPFPRSARDERERNGFLLEDREHFPRSLDERAALGRVEVEPRPVGVGPPVPRQPDHVVGPIPVGRVGRFEAVVVERDPERAEEALIAAQPGLRRVEERAVPVEEDRPKIYFSHLATHPSTSPYQCFEFWPFRTQWFSSG